MDDTREAGQVLWDAIEWSLVLLLLDVLPHYWDRSIHAQSSMETPLASLAQVLNEYYQPCAVTTTLLLDYGVSQAAVASSNVFIVDRNDMVLSVCFLLSKWENAGICWWLMFADFYTSLHIWIVLPPGRSLFPREREKSENNTDITICFFSPIHMKIVLVWKLTNSIFFSNAL